MNTIVLMDYDNIWISCHKDYNENIIEKNFVEKIIKYLQEKGHYLVEIIAYANFDNGKMASDKHQTLLQKSGIQTRHVMNGKDSADIALVCDALEKLYVTNLEIDTYVIVSCDRDITSLINKIKAKGKNVFLIPLAINIDWDVMKNYCTDYEWFEKIIDISFEEPTTKNTLDKEGFILELKDEIEFRKTDINYSLWSITLTKKYDVLKSQIDEIKNDLLQKGIIEFYDYEFQGKPFRDGIKFKNTVDNIREISYNKNEEDENLKEENAENENS